MSKNTVEKYGVSDFKYVAMLTDTLEKNPGSIKLRVRWMKVNNGLTVKFKTLRMMRRLLNNKTQ
jgi:hypothetical protein